MSEQSGELEVSADTISDLIAILGQARWDFLQALAAFATNFNLRTAMVGGIVRELFLFELGGFGSLPKEADIDIVFFPAGESLFEGVEDFLEQLETHWSEGFSNFGLSGVQAFPKYRTAKVFVSSLNDQASEDFEIDFSFSRKEFYPHPAQKPEVSPGSFFDDAQRRDFSVNALYLEIVSGGKLVGRDLMNGFADLKKRELRILHENSFSDDPVRVLRALRYMGRFNFKLECETEKALLETLQGKLLSLLSARRLYEELKKLLAEPELLRILNVSNTKLLFNCLSASLPVKASYNLDALRTVLEAAESGEEVSPEKKLRVLLGDNSAGLNSELLEYFKCGKKERKRILGP